MVFATKAMNHVEGGWPKEVDYTEAEHVIRYRKKVSPIAAVSAVLSREATSLKLNAASLSLNSGTSCKQVTWDITAIPPQIAVMITT